MPSTTAWMMNGRKVSLTPRLAGSASLSCRRMFVDAGHVDFEDDRDVRRGLIRQHHVLRDLLADHRAAARCGCLAGRTRRCRRGGGAGAPEPAGARAPAGGDRSARPARRGVTRVRGNPRCRVFVTRPRAPVPGSWRCRALCSATMRATTGDDEAACVAVAVRGDVRLVAPVGGGCRAGGASTALGTRVSACAAFGVARASLRRAVAEAPRAAGVARSRPPSPRRRSGDARAHVDRLALGDDDLRRRSRRRRGHLGVDLVGRDLDDRLVGARLARRPASPSA